MRKFSFILLGSIFFVACGKNSGTPNIPDIPEEEATLSVTPSRFTFPSEGRIETLFISSNYTWTISLEDAWCRPSVREGQGDLEVQVIADANPLLEDRETRWIINAGKYRSDTIHIFQNFKDGYLNFSDDQFQKYLLKNYDKNHDGYLSVSEAREVTAIGIQGNNLNLDGLNYFPELRTLSCIPLNFNSQFGIKELDVSQNEYLIFLDCRLNQLTKLDLSRSLGLESLYCSSNKIEELDLKDHGDLKTLHCGGNQLVTLNCENCFSLNEIYCNNNQLTSLDITTCEALTILSCNDNLITELDLSANAALESLACSNNQLTSLNVNSCPKLKILSCGNNPIQALEITNCPQLESLSLPKQLQYLKISNNEALYDLNHTNVGISDFLLERVVLENCTQLQSISFVSEQLKSLSVVSCPLLEELACILNQVTSLTIDNCTALQELSCSNNQLMALDVSDCSSLRELHCNNNQLTTLNLSGCTSLRELWCGNNQLTTLNVSNCTSLTKLWCYQNPNLKTIYKKKGQDIDISAPRDVEIIEL